MRGVYRTAQGKVINMDNLRFQHENERAVGNMGTNARGDQVDKHGNIIRNRNDIMKDHYNPANKRPRG